MKKLCRLLCIVAGLSTAHWAAAAQERAVGQWNGQIETPVGKLTLLVNIRESANAGFSGDLESIDQAPGQKIPLAAVAATPAKLTFEIPSIGASYDGSWQEAQHAWVGVFKQGIAFPLSLRAGDPPARPGVAGMDGQWRGTLLRDNARLRLILHFATGQGGTRATLDSPDLGAFGLAVERLERNGNTVQFEVPAANVIFNGKLNDTQQQLQGRWTRQGLPPATVMFVHDAVEAKPQARSQLPLKPAAYRSEELRFPNPAAADVVLAATLTLPEGPGPFPASILITGSGPQDRDETIYGHKPFAVLADALTRRGIAVLRCDDRGYAESSGNFDQATSADFASDANAAVAYLMHRPEIDHHAIGFIGHSEGGMVGPIAAADNPSVAFVVMLAGPGTGLERVLLSQHREAAHAQGATPAHAAKTEAIFGDIFHIVPTATKRQDGANRLNQLLTPETMRVLGLNDVQRAQLVLRMNSAWMHYLLNYQPAATLARVQVPVLALNGTIDRQVPVTENLAGLRAALAGNPDATILELPGLNHMFQPAVTGAMGEYAQIEETFAPQAMDIIANWVLGRFSRVAQ